MWLKLESKLTMGKYKNLTVRNVIERGDSGYLLWLHNSNLNIFLCQSVFTRMGNWQHYKNTARCQSNFCKNR